MAQKPKQKSGKKMSKYAAKVAARRIKAWKEGREEI